MTADSHSNSNDDAPQPPAHAQGAFFAGRLSAGQAEALVLKVAELSQAGLPLSAGLHAAAEEAGGGRLQRAFIALAGALDKGVPLEDILAAEKNRFPEHVRGLVVAAVQSGELAEVLLQLVDHQRRIRDQWREVLAAAAYPTLLLLSAAAVFILMNTLFMAPLGKMFEEFDFEIPHTTQVMLWVGEWLWPSVVVGCLGVLAALGAARVLLGAARWRWAVCHIPLVGPLWHWMGVSEWARLMSILLRHHLPLPRALQISAHAVRDPHVSRVSSILAERIEQGQSLQQAVLAGVDLPASARPFLAWGEKHTQLDQAFETISDAFEMRTRLRADLLRRVLPPFAFVMVGIFALFLFTGLLVPMMNLVNNLS